MRFVKVAAVASTSFALLLGSTAFARYHVRFDDLTPTLRAKVLQITHECKTRLISGYRPGARVAGSGRPSLHSAWPSRAADVAGDPSCIYAHLKGWSGGYSIDYSRVKHVHISYSPPRSGQMAGREWHARFRHYAGGYHRHYAQRFDHHRAGRVFMVHRRGRMGDMNPVGEHFNGHG